MSALSTLEAGAVGAVSGSIWKAAALALAALLLAVGGSLGIGWWLAARDRDRARVEFATEQVVSEQLRGAIREQNRAVEVMAAAKADADVQGRAAQQVAAANGRRFDGALANLSGVRATTCAEAMPAVNQLLEAIR